MVLNMQLPSCKSAFVLFTHVAIHNHFKQKTIEKEEGEEYKGKKKKYILSCSLGKRVKVHSSVGCCFTEADKATLICSK